MSRIEWRRLRNLTAREIINALTRDGFVLYNQPRLTPTLSPC